MPGGGGQGLGFFPDRPCQINIYEKYYDEIFELDTGATWNSLLLICLRWRLYEGGL